MSSVPTHTRAIAKPTSHSATNAGPGGTKSLAENQKQQTSAARARHLLDLPVLALAEHSAWTPTGLWQGQFDCAVWLRTPQGLPQPVQLFLRYVDNQGEKNVFIDRCHAGTFRTLLLNGSIALPVNGRVRSLEFHLVGANGAAEIGEEEWQLVPQQRQPR